MLIPVVIGAIALGGAFDFFKMEPRSVYQIFDYEAVKGNTVFQPNKKIESTYRVTESLSDVLDFLRIDNVLSLQAISGEVAFRGYGNHLAKFVDRNTTVEVLFLQEISTGLENFPLTTRQGHGWQGLPQHRVGTHFVGAIQYGGQLFVSIQFTAAEPEYFDEVKQAVIASIGNGGSTVDPAFFSKLQMVADDLDDKVILSLKVYTTAGMISPPTKMDQLARLVQEYPSIVETINYGKGAPLKIDLVDIHTVQSNFTEFKISHEVLESLDYVEMMYDDLRNAVYIFKQWDEPRPYLTPQQEKKVAKFLRRFKVVYRTLRRAISNLDLTGSPHQFDHARKAYNFDGKEKYYRFTVLVRELIRDIDGSSMYSQLFAIQEELSA